MPLLLEMRRGNSIVITATNFVNFADLSKIDIAVSKTNDVNPRK